MYIKTKYHRRLFMRILCIEQRNAIKRQHLKPFIFLVIKQEERKKTRLHKITALGKKVSSFSSFVPPPPLSFSQLFFLTAFSSSFEVGCCTEPDSQLSSESYPAFESLLEMSDAISLYFLLQFMLKLRH